MRTAALLFASVIAGATFGHAAEPNAFYWRGHVPQGLSVEIIGINGDVHAETATGTEVEIVADVPGPDGEKTKVNVALVQHENGVTACAVYPGTELGNRPSQCMGVNNEQGANENSDARVNFTIRVPKGVSLIGRTVNGGVDAQSLQSDIRAQTVNGKIRISTTRSAQAETVNGNIFATVGNLMSSAPGRFSTVNGSIELLLPPKTNTNLSAQTVNGTISSDIRMTGMKRTNARKLDGRVGQGGKCTLVKTVNGSIALKRTS